MKTSSKEILAPTHEELLWPVLKALKALGGSASIKELDDKVAELEKYSEEVQQIPHSDGRRTKLQYNCAWARTYLKKFEAIDNSSRGTWIILDKGEMLNQQQVSEIPSVVYRQRSIHRDNGPGAIDSDGKEDGPPDELDEHWKTKLLAVLGNIEPSAFERLCQLILRESGFIKVQVKGKSGDGGIDGVGILRIKLLSFHVSFQCKRYQGSVGSNHIRDFRGAMVGRGDKGLFITTGNFTADARLEANRDGAPAIDLIDGQDLCDLLKELRLGVVSNLVESVTIDPDWFQQI